MGSNPTGVVCALVGLVWPACLLACCPSACGIGPSGPSLFWRLGIATVVGMMVLSGRRCSPFGKLWSCFCGSARASPVCGGIVVSGVRQRIGCSGCVPLTDWAIAAQLDWRRSRAKGTQERRGITPQNLVGQFPVNLSLERTLTSDT